MKIIVWTLAAAVMISFVLWRKAVSEREEYREMVARMRNQIAGKAFHSMEALAREYGLRNRPIDLNPDPASYFAVDKYKIMTARDESMTIVEVELRWRYPSAGGSPEIRVTPWLGMGPLEVRLYSVSDVDTALALTRASTERWLKASRGS